MALGDAVNVSSPNYPMYYFDNQECIWYFTKNGNGTFVIEVIDILIETYDAILIGSGADHTEADSVLLSTNLILPEGTTIMKDEEHMWMIFRSYLSRRQRGFKMEWKVISNEGKCKTWCKH